MKETPTQEHIAEDEIDLIQLAKTLWKGRRQVIKTTLVFMAFGLFVALFTPKEYTASTTMVPQSSEGGTKLGGSLGGLAAMAGINLGSMGGSEIPPTLYPQIVQSIPFQQALMQTSLSIEGQDSPVTFYDYYTELKRPGLLGTLKKYTLGLPGLLLQALKGKPANKTVAEGGPTLLSITQEEKALIEQLQAQLSLAVNDKDGYVTLSASMPEALAAAQLAREAQTLLQAAITEFKVQKATDQLQFVEERYREKAAVYGSAQQALARFQDRNKNTATALAQTSLAQLQAEHDLAFSVYNELAKQLETQKIQVKEDTPVFTILEPVSVPLEKSKPKRSLILLIWTFLGGVLGIGLVLGKQALGGLQEQWDRKQ